MKFILSVLDFFFPVRVETKVVYGRPITVLDGDSDMFNVIRKWADDRNFVGGSDVKSQALKGISEYGEWADAVLKNDTPKIIDGFGDIVIVLTIAVHQLGMKLEDCILASYDEIKDRTGVMYNGAYIKSTDERYPAVLAEIAAGKV